MKIATFNVNSLRKRLPTILAWLTDNQPDVMCLQETKVQDGDFPVDAFREAGYAAAYRGMKSFNGVATLSRLSFGDLPPEQVTHGLHAGPDNEDVRFLHTVHHGLHVINTYVPQGYRIDSDKYAYKLEWFARLHHYFVARLKITDPVIWLGDLNVAPEPIDVYHPDRRGTDPDFHVDARNAYKAVVEWGFTDVFRRLHPDRIQYTYWDYYRKAFEHNWGWRIDHILATPDLAANCQDCDVDLEPRRIAEPSDHTIVWANFEWQPQVSNPS